MKRLAAVLLSGLLASQAFAASERQPAPPGALPDAPPQFTRFTPAELARGFLALAFGSDLRVGAATKGVRKFTHPARVHIMDMGSVSRAERYRAVVREFADTIPHLAAAITESVDDADIVVRLIDEKSFRRAMEEAYGRTVARRFVARTDPQCMTSVRSDAKGDILRSDVFIIVDQGDAVFLDCAYHETMHAFGLSNHDDRNPWTTLNQNRQVGYLSVYDRAMLTLLYDPRMTPGLTRAAVTTRLPRLIADLNLGQ